LLSLAVGALQLMLDRGEQKDWFASGEILLETAIAALGFWLFAVHTATAERPFLDPRLLKDRNFVGSSILIAVVGVILYATLALLPPMLQDLMNYPVMTTGIILMPRGVGTMVAMLAVGRLVTLVDVRVMLAFGFAVTAYSLYAMTGYSLEMDRWPIIWAGIVQGVGLGFLFVPLSTAAFSTLDPALRADAAGFFSLVRNVGGSIGISLIETLLAQTMQVSHASLAAHATPFNAALNQPSVQQFWDLGSTAGLAALNQEITRQAAMIAYLDDFKLMMLATLLALPLLLLLKPRRNAGGGVPVMD
jgi:DHA2 family multidrug resistance protein